jgi:hypothetical protein
MEFGVPDDGRNVPFTMAVGPLSEITSARAWQLVPSESQFSSWDSAQCGMNVEITPLSLLSDSETILPDATLS